MDVALEQGKVRLSPLTKVGAIPVSLTALLPFVG